MSLYFFRISHGRDAGVSGSVFDFADRDAAWTELTKVCGTMVGGICNNLKAKSDWRMELLDESKKPVFRIRLVADDV